MIRRERWFCLSLAQQLGNVGSEISRARQCETAGDETNREAALSRALDLLDVTLDDERLRATGRRKEIARLREVLADWYCRQGEYRIAPEALEEYCISFTLMPVP